MDENSPYALLAQQIPRCYKELQDKITEKVKECKEKDVPPVLDEKEFREDFEALFDDNDELNEAVNYLTLQGM